MTSQPIPPTPNAQSLPIVGASIVLATALGFLFNAIHAPDSVQASVLAVAVGLPAAVAYHRQSAQRDKVADFAQIAQGQLRRPIGLVVILFASLLLFGWGVSAWIGLHLFKPVIGSWPAWSICGFTLAWILSFLLASYASHYIAKHTYRWTTVSAGLVAVILVLAFVGDPFVQRAQGLNLVLRILMCVVAVTGFVGACLIGTWHGRRHHDEFLKKKLERIERSAAQRGVVLTGTPAQEVNSAPASRNHPASQQAEALPGSDLVSLLSRLAELRDAGVLTETEFQAKKAEILARM